MRGRSLEVKHRSVRLQVKSTAAEKEPWETLTPASAHPCHFPHVDLNCSLQGQHCLHFCYGGWDTNCSKDLPEALAIKGPLSCALLTALMGKTLVSSPLKHCCCVGCQPGTTPSNSQPCRAEKFSAPAKQPEVQRSNPKEEDFVLNTGLISILLRLSPPATWQPHRERSPLQVVGKQMPHSLESKQKLFYFHSQHKFFPRQKPCSGSRSCSAPRVEVPGR